MGSMLESLGIPTRAKVIAEHDRLSHIYLEAQVGQDWIALDGIYKNNPPGYAPTGTRSLVYDLHGGGLGGMLMTALIIGGLWYVLRSRK